MIRYLTIAALIIYSSVMSWDYYKNRDIIQEQKKEIETLYVQVDAWQLMFSNNMKVYTVDGYPLKKRKHNLMPKSEK